MLSSIMPENTIKLSLVVPAYNEEKIIKANLEEIVNYLSKQNYSWEIVVVDDGSRDVTSKIVSGLKNPKINLITLEKNRGKGAALRAGVGAANGEYIIFSDADLSVPIDFVEKFLATFKDGFNVVIGSRKAKGAKIIKHQPIIRETMGKFYTFLSRIVSGVNIADFTCGFKGFKKEAGKKIFANSLVDRWSYDVEIIFLANKYGYKIKEIPVSWVNRVESRVSLGNAVITSFLDLLKVRLNDILGKYVR